MNHKIILDASNPLPKSHSGIVTRKLHPPIKLFPRTKILLNRGAHLD